MPGKIMPTAKKGSMRALLHMRRSNQMHEFDAAMNLQLLREPNITWKTVP